MEGRCIEYAAKIEKGASDGYLGHILSKYTATLLGNMDLSDSISILEHVKRSKR